jgi:uncharacterized protein (TIGR02246 family)
VLSEADREAIRAVSQQWTERILARDFAGLAALYSEDAVFMPPNEPAVDGRANIQAWMESFPPVTAMDLQIVEIEGRGDLAYVWGSYTLTVAMPGAEPVEDTGKFIEIRRRAPDGTWPLARDIFNSDIPVPE